MNNLVILDSGHAEQVLGKEAPDKSLREWDFNNQMQYKIKPRLEAHGISVYLTNPSPKGENEMGLSKRCEIANLYWKNNKRISCIFLSLHANAHLPQFTSARGVETYVANNSSQKSKEAARYVQDEIFNTIKSIDKSAVDRGVKVANFTVIYKTAMPSILIEYAFYTNKEDLFILKNYKEELAEATVRGICKYFNIKYEPPTPIENKEKSLSKDIAYRVIAGSYLYKGVADRNSKKLKDIGVDVFIDIFEKDGKKYYRLVAGSYSSKENANKQKKMLEENKFSAFIVTK